MNGKCEKICLVHNIAEKQQPLLILECVEELELMRNRFYSNITEIKFIDQLKRNLDLCRSFCFSVSFIKRPGLRLLASNIEAAIARGAQGKLITSTYQNFTDIDSLQFFLRLQNEYPDRFACHLDRECFHDLNGNMLLQPHCLTT